MAFFSHAVTRDKLSILYMLRALDIEITRQQWINIMVGNEWINYFDLLSALTELEEDGYVAAIPRPFGHGYRLTERATQALEMFYKELPLSLRKAYDEYAKAHREELRRETQFQAISRPMPSGGFLVTLRVVEGASTLLEVKIQAPTNESANAACAAWESRSGDIYMYVLNTLLRPQEEETNEE